MVNGVAGLYQMIRNLAEKMKNKEFLDLEEECKLKKIKIIDQ